MDGQLSFRCLPSETGAPKLQSETTLTLRTPSLPCDCVAPGPGVLSGVKEGVGHGRRVGTGWKRDGKQEAALVPSIPLSSPTCDSVPLAGLCEKGTWGPPETRARLELLATFFGRRPQVSSERVSGGVSKNTTIQRPNIINRMPRRA